MLQWLTGSRPDHPLADVKAARRIIGELPQSDPFKALEEVSDWIESVSVTEGFRVGDLAELTKMLDEAGQPHARRLGRDYMSAPRLQKFHENRLWTTLHTFWSRLAQAYLKAIEMEAGGAKGAGDIRKQLPLVACRAMRGVAQALKWEQVRYGPIDSGLWLRVGRLHALGSSLGIARHPVTPYAAIPGETTLEAEFLRTMVLWSSAPNSLLPLGVEVAERLTAHFSGQFALVEGEAGGFSHVFDLNAGRPPSRLPHAAAARPGVVLFRADAAVPAVEELREKVVQSGVPPEVNLGGAYDARLVADVLAHLARHWSTEPPARRHERHRIKTRISVVSGFESIFDTVDGAGFFMVPSTESWIVENISAGGFGAEVPASRPEWIRVGLLLGVQPEGVDAWGIGIIRRVEHDHHGICRVGVQTLARTASAAHVGPAGEDTREPALLLKGVNGNGDSEGVATLLLKAGTYSVQSLDCEAEERRLLMIPVELTEKGEDFDLARYRQMERSGSDD